MPPSPEEFEQMLRNLAKCIRDTKSSVNGFWSSVLSCVKENFISRARCIEVLCRFLLTSLVEFGCHDYNLVLQIIEVYKRWVCEKRWVFADFLSEYIDKKYILKPLFGVGGETSLYDDFDMAYEIGDNMYTKALLMYGMLKPVEFAMERRSCHHMIKGCGCDPFKGISDSVWDLSNALIALQHIQHSVQKHYSQATSYDDINALASDLHNTYYSKQGSLGIRRISIISYVLKAIWMKVNKHPKASDFVECLNLYNCVMPDPFVSENEVRGFVRFLFRREDYQENVTADFTNAYKSLFHPDMYRSLRPRSLQHLSRCAVRSILASKKRVFPDMVNSLPVPDSMKDFLLGEPEHRFY